MRLWSARYRTRLNSRTGYAKARSEGETSDAAPDPRARAPVENYRVLGRPLSDRILRWEAVVVKAEVGSWVGSAVNESYTRRRQCQVRLAQLRGASYISGHHEPPERT